MYNEKCVYGCTWTGEYIHYIFTIPIVYVSICILNLEWNNALQ